MKTKYWIMIFAAIALVLVGCCLMLIPRGQANAVQVWSEGKLLQTLPLNVDTTVEVKTDRGINIVTVADGKAWVEHADCPDKTCAKQGKRQSGQIICLPNRLVLKFIGSQKTDGIVG